MSLEVSEIPLNCLHIQWHKFSTSVNWIQIKMWVLIKVRVWYDGNCYLGEWRGDGGCFGIWLICQQSWLPATDVYAVALFTVRVSTYCDSSGPWYPPLSWDANLTLQRNSDTVPRGQTYFVLRFQFVHISVWKRRCDPAVPPHRKCQSDTYRNTWLSRGSCLSRLSWITLVQKTREEF